MTQGQWITRVVKPVAFIACLGPLALMVHDTLTGGLGANPIEELTHRTGTTTITLLMITLAVTPARTLLRLPSLVLLRRMFGVFAFFYVVLHFSIYLLDQYPYSLATVLDDVAKRPYITVGFTSFLLLIPLAVTSTNKMVKRLGGKRWQKLHQLVYVAAAGGVLHFLWQVKADARRPVFYGVVLIALLSVRLWKTRAGKRRAQRTQQLVTPAPSAAARD